MRYFYLILVVSLFPACRSLKPKGPRPAMPIMKVVSVSSSLMYSYTMEVEGNELVPQIQTIAVTTDGDGCVMDRHGICALPITSDHVRFTVAGFAADGREIDICSAGALTVDLVHRYDVGEVIGARILAREAQAEREGGQCVFTLVERYAVLP